jgi:amino acid adenylation domain-containing protein
MFDAQVRRTPEAVAVEGEGGLLTYAELRRRADRLALILRAHGVGPGVPVAICVERSAEMVVGLLGVLKAGGAYIPLDPGYPPERISFMIAHSRTPILLTQRRSLDRLPRETPSVVCLEDCRIEGPGCECEEADLLPPSGDDLAYVIYTSGSTGQPKGVAIPHRALANFLLSMRRQPGLSADDALLAVTTICFDIAGLELFLPLIVGARTVIASRETATSGERLMARMEAAGITAMQATPATWRLLLEAGWRGGPHLRVMCGGEAMDRALAEALSRRCGSLWNLYGPTETTIWSTLYRVETGPGAVPIGRPIRNTTVYILDEHLRLVPEGEPGELYIGGAGLALGYLHRPDLTAERFIADPFSIDQGARIYRTGDLARRRPDGELECLGRTDHQVKIRGYRIELGEIEAALAAEKGVRQAVVVARDGAAGSKRLVAYLVASGSAAPSTSELRRGLARTLPDYMIPSAFVTLPALPLTPNGKVDRKTLPDAPSDRPDLERVYVAPRDSIESRIAAIWEEVLGIRPIGIRDNIFELGVDSLIAARLFVQIEKKFSRKLPPAPLFAAPTIELLAEHVRERKGTGRLTSLVAIQPKGKRPPLFCVHGGAGTIIHLNELARLLEPDQPFYGLQSKGLYGRVAPLSTVEEMAAHYIQEIRSLFPEGPYSLSAYCFGGVVALEMAHQLQAAGQEVATIVLINTPEPAQMRRGAPSGGQLPRSPANSGRLARYLGKLRGPDGSIRWVHVRRRVVKSLMWKLKNLPMRARRALGLPLPDAVRDQYFLIFHEIADRQYTPRPTTAPIALFLGEGVYDDAPAAWARLAAGPFELHRIPGDHRRGNPDHPLLGSQRLLLKPPAVGLLAGFLEDYLDRRQTENAYEVAPVAVLS